MAGVRGFGVPAGRRRARAGVGAGEVATAGDGRVDDGPTTVADKFVVRGFEAGRAGAFVVERGARVIAA